MKTKPPVLPSPISPHLHSGVPPATDPAVVSRQVGASLLQSTSAAPYPTARTVLQLQRMVGNRAVGRLLTRGVPQASGMPAPPEGTSQPTLLQRLHQKHAHLTPSLSPSDLSILPEAPTQPVLQRYFDGLPNAKEVEVAAHSATLTPEQVDILKWAATAPTAFGALQAYLQNPKLIEAKIAPVLLPETEKGQTAEKNKQRGWEDSRLPPKKRSYHRSQTPPTIRARPLIIGAAWVPGTLDLAQDTNTELQAFEHALQTTAYTRKELELLQNLLLRRHAPLDPERLKRLKPYLSRFDEEEEEEVDPREVDTETEGSDSEQEQSYSLDRTRRQSTEGRLNREQDLLKPHLTQQRLTHLLKAKTPQAQLDVIFKPTTEKKKKTSVEATATKKIKQEAETKTKPKAKPKKVAQRPQKPKLYRKEAKFNHPSVNVGERAELPTKPTAQQIQDLAQLNALLALDVPIALATQLIDSRFVIAQYRGMFYNRDTFTHESRAKHRSLDELNRPIFSTAALAEGRLGFAGYYYLYSEQSRHADLTLYQREIALEGRRIHEKLLALRTKPATEEVRKGVGRATTLFKPQTLADIGTHLYSEDYDKYHQVLKEKQEGAAKKTSAPNPLFSVVEGLPNASNPKVSTGDVPTHAARYAYGLKPYKGHEEEILEPTYDAKGKPRHPYSGKMYASIHPLSDYDESTGPSSLVPLQSEGRINIGKVIIPERETQFEGMVESDRVKWQMKAKFPNFAKPYKAVYSERYGFTPELFQAFQRALQQTKPESDERSCAEALTPEHPALHSAMLASEAALQEAAKQKSHLIYRTGLRSFGFTPPPLPDQKKGQPKPLLPEKPLTIAAALTLLTKKGEAFQEMALEGSSAMVSSPLNLPDQVTQQYGKVHPIDGSNIACYIRSLVTAAARVHGLLEENQIENMVSAITDHLGHIQLRTRRQMVDAGGLVAAEVRRVLTVFANFDPAVHIVMWDDSIGQVTEFLANSGTHHVWLFFTPGHFDLILK